MAYAERTSVPPERSRAEIERTLARFGADAFGFAMDGQRAAITFRAEGRMVRFELAVPQGRDFSRTTQRDQAERSNWRALVLAIKAKLAAVEAGIVTFEEEFLAHIVLPDNTTTGDWLIPQIREAYETGEMPELLPPTRAQLGAGS